MTKLGYVLLAPLSALVISACGSSTNATASGVFPAQGFTGRQLRVEISGDATDWKDGATVSFGTGVTVGTVTVASPTDVFADITIDPAAAVGPVDVTVTSGGTFTLKQAFELKAPIDIAFSGALAQGGLPLFTITNHDFDNPFDTTTDANGAFTNTTVSGPAKTQFSVNSLTEYTIKGQAFIDLDAAAGALSVSSGATNPITSNLAANIAITARTPMALSGTASGMLSGDGDSQLYSVTASGTPAVVHVNVTPTSSTASFGAAIFTDTTWTHAGGTFLITNAGGTFPIVVGSLSGASNYQIAGAAEQLTSAPEGANDTANGTAGGALVASALPFMQTGGTLSSASDQDWIKVTIAAGDANKHLHIITNAGTDPNTDTTVAMINSGTNADVLTTAEGGLPPPVDQSDCSLLGCTDLGENVVSDALPVGTYLVKIGAGPAYATTDTAYVVAMWLE